MQSKRSIKSLNFVKESCVSLRHSGIY